MSLWDVARLAGSDLLQEADYASVLATALLEFGDGLDLALTPGAGLIWHAKKLRIVVLADAKRSGLEPGVPVLLGQSPIIASRVADALRGSPDWIAWIDILAVLPSPPPRPETWPAPLRRPGQHRRRPLYLFYFCWSR